MVLFFLYICGVESVCGIHEGTNSPLFCSRYFGGMVKCTIFIMLLAFPFVDGFLYGRSIPNREGCIKIG